MPFFEANGITFHFADDNNDRTPFVFQHGLGADISQPMAFFGKDRPFRLISLDCRGHGKTGQWYYYYDGTWWPVQAPNHSR